MPSGRILVLSLALGIYTRRTATGCHEFRVACTCTATSARARLVSATCPSTPAVLRPVLRCVTWRTLISVLDQDANIQWVRRRSRLVAWCDDRWAGASGSGGRAVGPG